MRVHILDDYDNDLFIIPERSHSSEPVYEVPENLIKEYDDASNKLNAIKNKLALIRRQGPL